MNAREMTQRLKNGEELRVLDVREELEFHTFNIGGMNIPLAKLADNLLSIKWNKEDEIIVICKVGLRSQTAKAILEQHGFRGARNLEGGLIGLRRQLLKEGVIE